MNEFITPLFLAIVWVTLGCTVTRFFWRTDYDYLCALWLAMTFGFTLFNRVFVLDHFVWPANIMLSGIAMFAPMVTNFTYSAKCGTPNSDREWAAKLYGILVMTATAFLTLNSRVVFEDIANASNHSSGPIGLIVITLSMISVGLLGLYVLARSFRKDD